MTTTTLGPIPRLAIEIHLEHEELAQLSVILKDFPGNATGADIYRNTVVVGYDIQSANQDLAGLALSGTFGADVRNIIAANNILITELFSTKTLTSWSRSQAWVVAINAAEDRWAAAVAAVVAHGDIYLSPTTTPTVL